MANFITPKKQQILIHAYPDIEDQLVAVLRWLAANSHPYSVVVLVSGAKKVVEEELFRFIGGFTERIQLIEKNSLRGVLAYCRSRFILFTHGLYGVFPVPRRQYVVNLWHGMPLKGIWNAIPNAPVPPCTWLLSTSDTFSSVLASVSGFPLEKIKAIGLPRNDLLFSGTPKVGAFTQRVHANVEKVAIFLPTYRQSAVGYITTDGREASNPLYMSEEEIASLCSVLVEAKTRMLVKPHPMSVHYGRDYEIAENLWVISDSWLHSQGVTLYEALGQSELLVTDISSVYVDYLATGRPIIYYFPDIDMYRNTRKFLFEPIEEWLAGRLCTTSSELFAELSEQGRNIDAYLEKRSKLAEVLNSCGDSAATGRLFRLLAEARSM